MKFENPEIPESINTSDEHPLREFFWLLFAVAIATLLLSAALGFSAGWLAKQIPFATERRFAQSFIEEPAPSRVRDYLQDVTDRILSAQEIPADLRISVHYEPEDVVNAYATLGGHVHFYRGLLARLPNEEAIAMVVAHEIAHILHRDPIAAFTRELTVGGALAVFSGFGGSAVSNQLSEISQLATRSFSRAQEEAADAAALAALVNAYGNASGATALFDLFASLETERFRPALLSTHPHAADRLRETRHRCAEHGWDMNSKTTPLPLWFVEAVNRPDTS